MSQLALDLIVIEKKLRTGYLDLGNCGLTELPEELFELTHLETLILSSDYYDYEQKKQIYSPNNGLPNLLEFLPKAVSRLQNLKKLVGRFSRLSNIDVLAKLSTLEILCLRESNISNINISCDEGLVVTMMCYKRETLQKNSAIL